MDTTAPCSPLQTAQSKRVACQVHCTIFLLNARNNVLYLLELSGAAFRIIESVSCHFVQNVTENSFINRLQIVSAYEEVNIAYDFAHEKIDSFFFRLIQNI